MNRLVGFVWLTLTLAIARPVFAETWDFEDAQPDSLPAGWVVARTGEGPGGVWKILEDNSGPSGGRVLGQVSLEGPRPVFNLCICSDVNLQDLSLHVAFKAVSGEIDQGGGPVWRYHDANNYYIARVNPLEDNFRVYKVVDGKRTQLATADVKVPMDQWHRIHISQRGDRIRCFLDDKLQLDVSDNTLSEAGKIGLWTKADAVTYFDALEAHAAGQALLPDLQPDEKDFPGLHRLIRVSDRIYSGAEPAGDAGFESLHKLGVRIIVSVDGARPDVETARKYGLRYVHIPIAYNGIPTQAKAQLARVMEEAGPIYFHCHHGQHRGPAAAAVACIATGEADGESAKAILRKAGTSEKYPGLWRDVERYQSPAPGATLPDLQEIAEVPSMAAAMSGIGRAFDNLKLCQTSEWNTPQDHPDLVPVREAQILADALGHAATLAAAKSDARMSQWMSQATTAATELESSLRGAELAKAPHIFSVLQQTCTQCHKQFRD